MSARSINYLFLTAALCWMGIIFYVSSQPGQDITPLFPGQDKLVHLVSYGILGFLLTGAVRPAQLGYRSRHFWIVVLLSACYGISDEFHQLFVPGRTADIYDIVADAAGALLGAVMMVQTARMLRIRSAGRTK